MVLEDWTNCPHCEFPALASHLKPVVEQTGQCPMCSEVLDVSQIQIVSKPEEHLKGKMSSLEYEQSKTSQVQAPIAATSNKETARIGGLVI
jgi:WD repeat-containing protein 19